MDPREWGFPLPRSPEIRTSKHLKGRKREGGRSILKPEDLSGVPMPQEKKKAAKKKSPTPPDGNWLEEEGFGIPG
ncbi:MAG: hypothetical protein G01um1014107_372 [Parcubacteria group bacterium Gr01-1014_107]|nr:MAG: hypothetical protein G01um1014107_372 [Parcubacteria group bacterium Gr01-1014_107]